MSLLKSIKQQLGLSTTASENHFWDGTTANQLSLKRGTPDAVGATVMTVNAGVVSFPQGVSGSVIQVVEATPYTTASSFTAQIPSDSTIPQNTEGTEFITVTITPKSATSRLRIESHCGLMDASGGTTVIATLFKDSDANAIAFSCNTPTNASYLFQLALRHEMVSGTTSPVTFKIRLGVVGAYTGYINRRQTGETFGGISALRLSVTEVAA